MYNHMTELYGYIKDLIKPTIVGVYICRIKYWGTSAQSLRRQELLVALVHKHFLHRLQSAV